MIASEKEIEAAARCLEPSAWARHDHLLARYTPGIEMSRDELCRHNRHDQTIQLFWQLNIDTYEKVKHWLWTDDDSYHGNMLRWSKKVATDALAAAAAVRESGL